MTRATAPVLAVLEQLEARRLLAATPFISEFLASNVPAAAGDPPDVFPNVDEDGSSSDWIEIANPSAEPINLDGYYLTDDPSDLTKWRIPAVTIAGSGYLVVFASNKNRSDPAAPLHTNFELSAGGEYLALVAPDGTTVLSSYDYPQQAPDVSYGLAADVVETPFITAGGAARVKVPADASEDATWRDPGFDDSAWQQGTTGVGYDTQPPVPPFRGFTVRMVDTLSGPLDSIAQATALLDGNATGYTIVSDTSVNQSTINFDGTGYGSDNPLPNGATTSTAQDDDLRNYYAVRATANVFIPAGTWTIAAGSDDGVRLKITGVTFTNKINENGPPTPSDTIAFSDPRGHAWTMGTFTVPAGGLNATLTLDVYERTGGDSFELAIAQGAQGNFTGMPTFQLLADGVMGWQVSSPAVSSPTSFLPLINTNVQAAMYGNRSSAYVRMTFNVPDGPIDIDNLRLRIKYDDGFVAYLNGQVIARRNAPAGTTLPYTASATGTRADTDAIVYEVLDIAFEPGMLVPGQNVLAIHGLNDSAGSDDFLVLPELIGLTTVGQEERRYFANPTPGGPNDPASTTDVVGDTSFSVDRGFYTAPFHVSITVPTPGATIRYTLDGSAPTDTTGIVYTGPILIDRTTVLRAAAFKVGAIPSDVDTQTYIFLNDVIQQSPNGQVPDGWDNKYSSWGSNVVDYGMDPDIVNHPVYGPQLLDALTGLPTVSLTMDLDDLFDPGTGIYANPGGDGAAWERPGSVEMLDPTGAEDGFHVNAGIRIRGGFSRSTANPKHAFRVFMRSKYGDGSLDYPLFGEEGLPEYEVFDLRTFQNYSWSFQGDPSGIFVRDRSSREMQLAMGHEGERGRYVHLYINGQYWGIYELVERPEADTAAAYFGGSDDDYDVIKSDPDLGYNIEATDGDLTAWTELWTKLNQLVEIANGGGDTFPLYMELQGLNLDGTRNPNIEALIDVDNLIDYMLVIFYGGNLDAPISNFLSNQSPNNFFAVRPRDGRFGFRFYVHDAEHTLLNVNEDRTGPWPAGQQLSKSNPQWFFQQLMVSPEFRLRVADHVRKHFFNDGVLTTTGVANLLNRLKAELQTPVIAESARWGDAKTASPLTQANWLSAFNNVLNNYVPSRSNIVFNQLAADGLYTTSLLPPNFNQHGGQVSSGFQLTMTNPNGATGTIYYRLDGLDPRMPGGGIRPGSLVYSTAVSLTSSARVLARVYNPSTGAWSALNEAEFRFDLSALKLTELMYNPLPDPGQTSGAAQDYEYIELMNTGSDPMQLGGIRFTSGVDFTFPAMTLAPQQRVLVVRNAAAFQSRYGTPPGALIAGQYGVGADPDNLANGGERLTLVGPLGEPIFDFEYSDEWYKYGDDPGSVTDGQGFSLVVRDPAHATDAILGDEDGWRPSQFIHGAPGLADPGLDPESVVFSEAMANYSGPGGDWLELENTTDQPIDISGWYLSDSHLDLQKYQVPAGTVIPPHGFVTFMESQFGMPGGPGVITPFELSAVRGQLYLTAGDGLGGIGGYRDYADFMGSEEGVTYGRYVKSTGGSDFVRLITPTFGAFNAAPVVGGLVINEVHYHPLSGDEFIELHNRTSEPIQLFDPAFPDDPERTWRLIDGLDFVFPTNVTIPAGGYALVVPIDPAAFIATYNVPAGVQVFGPWSPDGSVSLSNSRANLKLVRPLAPVVEGGVTVTPFAIVDQVRYSDSGAWPPEPDGLGPSLTRVNPAVYGNDAANWRSGPIGGTPGRTNVIATPDAPTDLALGGPVATNRVTLVWVDNAVGEDGYRVERSTDGISFQQIASLPPNVTTYNALGLTPGTTYHFRVRAYNSAGSSPYSNVLVATTASLPPPGNGTGLLGSYWSNMDFTGTNVVRIDPTVNFAWGDGGPDPAIGSDTFSARWEGKVQPLFDEVYTFYTYSDDGVRLWVNGQLIINNWTDHSPTENAGTIALAAGQKYDLRMEFYENGGGADARLLWSSPSQEKQVIPTSQLYPPATPPPAPVTNVSAVGTGSDRVLLRWTDASSNETGFKIERLAGSTWVPVGTAPANATSFVVAGLSASTSYQFRVIATNDGGDAPASSASVTTPAAGVGSPAALWALNEGSGTTAGDSSGNGNTLTLQTATFSAAAAQTGSFGLSFPSSGSPQGRANNHASLNPTSAITLAAWVNATTWNGSRRIIQKGSNDNQYRLQVSNGQLLMELEGVGTVTGTAPSTGAWHHVAGTYDGATLRLYVDGNLVGSQAATGSINTTINPLYVGARSSATSTQRFSGLMDDVRVYSRALTEAEVRTLVSVLGAPAGAPTGLTATAIRSLQVQLAWNDVHRNEYGYRVERRALPSGAWTDIGFAPAPAASGQATFLDNIGGLQEGVTYAYRVRALNNNGFSAYSAEATATAYVTTLPQPWAASDVGSPAIEGSADWAAGGGPGGTFTVRGSGADIFGTADGFQYVYQTLAGDGAIIARVVSVQDTNAHAKAGVMIRQDLTAGSAYAYVGVKPGTTGLFYEARASAGASASSIGSQGSVSAPYWVRLVRSGNLLSAFVSSNGTIWTPIGSPQTIALNGPVYVGLAVTAHNDALLNTSTFDNVSVSQTINAAGTASADTFHVSLDASGANVQVWRNANPAVDPPTYFVAKSGLTTFTIDGLGGDDRVILDLSNGNPLPASGLNFVGGAGTDRLEILGSSGNDTVAMAGSQVMVGSATVNMNGAEQAVISGGGGADSFSVTTSTPLGYTPLFMSVPAGTATLNVAGGPFTLVNGEPGGAPLGLAVTVQSGASLSLASSQDLASLTLLGTASAAFTPGGAKVLRVSSLSLSPNATLDLKDNDLIVQATPETKDDVYLAVLQLVRSARNGGAWDGKGITSTTAAGLAARVAGLGVVLNDDGEGNPLHATFAGDSVDADAILVKYTWDGDATLDGVVDADDYLAIDRAFVRRDLPGTPPTGWANGDFNHDGAVDAGDYLLIDRGSSLQGGPLGAGAPAPAPAPAPEQEQAAAAAPWPWAFSPQVDDDAEDDDEADDEVQALAGTIEELL